MYHKGTLFTKSYYDTIEEMPNKAKVYFPDSKETVEMTVEEILKLSDEGWYTIMHEVNYGCCDHWTSQPLKKWVNERFLQIITYVNKNGETVGYDRREWSVKLTKDAHYWKSEVWNS